MSWNFKLEDGYGGGLRHLANITDAGARPVFLNLVLTFLHA